MSRGFGEVELIQELLPEWMAVPVALATQLGDVWFLSLLLAVLYVGRAADRDAVAVVAGLTLGGLALLDALKHTFALPRPDLPLLPAHVLPEWVQPLYEATAFAAGYGFPSGHALMTTVVYLGLAIVLPVATRRRRFVAAGVLIVVVSLSRVALGVHYLVDVVAGVGLGILFLGATGAALSRLSDRATAAFLLAVVLGGLNLVVGDPDADALLLSGASLGAFAGWQLGLARRGLGTDREGTAAGRARLRAVAALVALAPLVVVVAYGRFAWPVSSVGLVGLAVAVAVFVPVFLEDRRGGRGS